VSEKDIGSCHDGLYLEKAAFHNKSGREGEETILPNQRLFSFVANVLERGTCEKRQTL
jgi:hypothetical protein